MGMGRMRRMVLLTGAAAVFAASGFAPASDYASGEAGILRSATYYSDDWVVNFWNSESVNMEQELLQIAQDGFNNIILCIPWREFQPQLTPAAYNDYAWDKLERVMEAAKKQNLSVMLRVGYTWDYGGSDNVLDRYGRLLYDSNTVNGWLDYVERLYQKASAHENFCGGFLTWEDFWNFTATAVSLGKTEESRRMAKKTGYLDYAREHYELEEICRLYDGEITEWEEIYFPSGELPAMKVFYEFYDDFLNRILEESQKVFPDLSMEVRLDMDPIYGMDETMYGFSHESTFSCQDSAFTSAMYSMSMGQSRQKELTARQALDQMPGVLDRLFSFSGGKPIYLDQLLFTDNTPGFEENPRLAEAEEAEFLRSAAPVLEEYTMGYGIWTYRDYCNNKLYNSQFALGTKGWETSGVRVAEEDNRRAALSSKASLSQKIDNRQTGIAGEGVKVSFWAESQGTSDLTVGLGGLSKALTISGTQKVELDFGNVPLDRLTIENSGAQLFVDNVKVYTWITEGKIYEFDGQPGECRKAVRQLNDELN